jgi:hypothetical protein
VNPLHARVSAQKLAAVRIVLFTLLGGYALVVPGEYLGLLPPSFHRGVGWSDLLPRILFSPSGLASVRYAAALLLFASALGVKPFRPLALGGVALFTLYLALIGSSHRELAAVYLGVALALGPSATVWSVGPRLHEPTPVKPEAFAATLQLATFVFLLTYALIGAERLIRAAPDAFLDGSLIWHIASNSDRNGTFRFTFGYRLLEHVPHARAFFGAGFLVSTLFEALAPLALFFRGFRRAFVLFALAFHTANLVLMNIEFTLNCVVLVLLLVDWEPPSAHRATEATPAPAERDAPREQPVGD